MTISNTNSRMDYTGDGGTDTYAYTFKIFSESSLLVTQRDLSNVESTLVLNTDYTVTGEGETAGGTIVLTAGNLTSGYLLAIRRKRPITQGTDIRNEGDFFPEIHEDVFDKLVMVDQQQQNDIDRSIKLPETGTGVDPTMPVPEALKYIRWNALGTSLENISPGNTILAIPASESVTADMIDTAETSAILTKLSAPLKAEIQAGGLVYIADTGAADVYVGTYVPALTLYTSGMVMGLKITNANLTTTPTAEFNGLGALTIKRLGSTALKVADLPVGHLAILWHNGTDLILLNPALHDHSSSTQGGPCKGQKALYRYVVGTTVHGGTSVSVTWNVRPLNTEEYDDIGISLSSNQMTVPAGTYRIKAMGVTKTSGQANRLAIYNITDTSYDLIGLSCADTSATSVSIASLTGEITLTAEKVLELRHYTGSGLANQGLGSYINTGENNVYTSIEFEKVA